MENTWDYSFSDNSVWGWILVFAVLLGSLLAANMMKKYIPILKKALIPTSVLGGSIILVVAAIYKAITGDIMFDTAAFNGNGTKNLEIITYHALALGFIASSLKTTSSKINKKRSGEIFNTGVTTVATYLLQGAFGLGITLIATLIIKDFFAAAGVLLPFGYGQGTGQALNYGMIYESQGFVGGKSFGLTIAALGFLSASFGGVIHLNIMKRLGKLKTSNRNDGSVEDQRIETYNEIPMQSSIDKITIQVAFILVGYAITYFIMLGVSKLVPGLESIIFGFNFLIGVIVATVIKLLLNLAYKKRVINHKYTNNFLLTRLSNFFFDLMVISGIAAIRLSILESYWGLILILGVVGAAITYIYNRIVAKTLFGEYVEEQFLTMYGMLTGTASTGIILLREIDGDFKTPASDNMIFQNFVAIVLGFPMMFLANLAPQYPIPVLIAFVLLFIILNVVLFRSKIFKRRK